MNTFAECRRQENEQFSLSMQNVITIQFFNLGVVLLQNLQQAQMSMLGRCCFSCTSCCYPCTSCYCPTSTNYCWTNTSSSTTYAAFFTTTSSRVAMMFYHDFFLWIFSLFVHDKRGSRLKHARAHTHMYIYLHSYSSYSSFYHALKLLNSGGVCTFFIYLFYYITHNHVLLYLFYSDYVLS